jgi:tetratricopeptide (TPR) repeat protein
LTSQVQYQKALRQCQQGRWTEAVQSLAICLRGAPDEPVAALELMGLSLAQSGHPEKAVPFFQRVIELIGSLATSGHFLNLGNALFAINRVSEAEGYFRQATDRDPNSGQAWGNLGLALKGQGKRKQALVAFQNAVHLDPKAISYRLNWGNTLAELGRFPEAEAQLRELCLSHETCALAHAAHGRVLLATGRVKDALNALEKACRLEPTKAQFHLNHGVALALSGHVAEPIKAFREAIRLKPDYWTAWVDLGSILAETGQVEEARHCFQEVLKVHPNHQNALAGLAGLLNRSGNYEQVLGLLKPQLSDAQACSVNSAVAYGTACIGVHRSEDGLQLLKKVLERVHNKPEQSLLWHALARSMDQLERYDDAFEAYKNSNALRCLKFSPSDHIQKVTGILASFDRRSLAQLPSMGCDSDAPVFIVGMPRSGTSLVEQILSSHSDIYGAGELEFVQKLAGGLSRHGSIYEGLQKSRPEALAQAAEVHMEGLKSQAGQALRITDKMPGNFLYLGLVQKLFPNAKIIHCRRSMLDTCISCFRQNFPASHAYATRLDWLAVYYQQYERLMEHWKNTLDLDILEVEYESLVQDSEVQIRKMVAFCGQEMQADCLSPHLNPRVVITASQAQVREPINTRSIGSSMRYSAHITPLLNTENPT